MSRSPHSADEIREELERVSASLSSNGEGLNLEFRRPFPVGPHWPFTHNWDVRVVVPAGLEDLAFRAIDDVAARWDLEQK